MSYSGYGQVKASTLPEDIEAITISGQEGEHVDEAVNVAKNLVTDLIESGVVGDAHVYTVSISGHTNPGHVPAEGWGNDHMAISVSQLQAE